MSSSTENTAPAVMRSETGYIGSLVIHLAVIGVAVLLARLAPEVRDMEDHDPLLLEVWQGDGSDRAPGIPGRDRGVAEGVATGDKSKAGLGGLPRMNRLNAKSLLKTLKENEALAAKEAAEAAAREAASKSEAKSSKVPAKPETLDDFNKATGKTGKAAVKPVAGGKTGNSGISGSIVGGQGTGKGSGADGFGRAAGKGQNGGDGGSGDAMKLFLGDVRGKFADIFVPLFREQGGDLESSRDKGEVRVAVSSSGLVSFVGWAVRPSDPLVERLVKEAILKMRPVRPPPGGDTATVIIPVSGSVVE